MEANLNKIGFSENCLYRPKAVFTMLIKISYATLRTCFIRSVVYSVKCKQIKFSLKLTVTNDGKAKYFMCGFEFEQGSVSD